VYRPQIKYPNKKKSTKYHKIGISLNPEGLEKKKKRLEQRLKTIEVIKTKKAISKPVVERSIKRNRIAPPKGTLIRKRVILPLVIDLPIHKDKKGNIIEIKNKAGKVIKTYTKYQVTYIQVTA
jgi:hypothetical protein